MSPTTGVRWQLKTPLDFLVVSDHAEMIGSIPRLYKGDPVIADTESGRALLEISPDQTEEQFQQVYDQIVLIGSGLEDQADIDISAQQFIKDMHAGEKRRTTWDETIDAAERHNDPGTFTALIGCKWSAQPKGGHLHRVVFMPEGADGKLAPIGNSADLKTGRHTNDIGEETLAGLWQDPDFDAAQPAFYYARVLQIPTPRHSLLDAIALGLDVEETGRPATIQERAYTSPIWCTPEAR